MTRLPSMTAPRSMTWPGIQNRPPDRDWILTAGID